MRLILSATLVLGVLASMSPADHHEKHEHECALDYKMKTIKGETVDLEDYEGNVVLIVNTASQCGLTPHYEGLQSLYEKYKDKGFVVLGFPCNQFGSQEPGSDADIAKFCKASYGVSFPMFSKIEVNGEGAAPLYKHLTSVDAKPRGKGPVKWNFEKFVIDREGHVAARFKHGTNPNDAELLKTIESELKKSK